MEYSQLNRDFKEKDVQRLRNLIGDKYGDKTVTQVGREKQDVEHKEGDVWEENEKTWTIKDGLKQTYTKLDALKKAIRMPYCCPNCKKAMKHILDSKYYSLHNKCFDCVVKIETEMRMNGTYRQYAENFITENVISFIDEAAEFIEDYEKQSDDVFYTEQGEKEIIAGGSKKYSKLEEWKKELAEMKKNLSESREKLKPLQ